MSKQTHPLFLFLKAYSVRKRNNRFHQNSRLFFQKGLTVSTKMVKCFDKKEDVSILTHPLTFYSIRNLMDFLSYTIGKLS